jgi:fission process protein 1
MPVVPAPVKETLHDVKEQVKDKLPLQSPLQLVKTTEEDLSTTDTFGRYAAYLRRLIPLWRYAAYTSDIGEAFRPVAHPHLVTASYAMSWCYVAGDVAYEGYKDYNDGVRGMILAQHVTKRATFQAIASMALPAFTIHSVVHLCKHHLFKKAHPKLHSLGPTAAGLMCIPFLPMYDEPVEHATEAFFERAWPTGEPPKHAHHEKTL